MTDKLTHFSIQFYRGIGSELQKITGLTDMNLFVGPNNSGKSIVLNFIASHLPLSNDTHKSISANCAEYHRGHSTGEPSLSIGLEVGKLLELIRIKSNPDSFHVVYDVFLKLLNSLCDENELIWLEVDKATLRLPVSTYEHPKLGSLTVSEWQYAWRYFEPERMISSMEVMKGEVLRTIEKLYHINLPATNLIPAKRVLGPKSDAFDDLSGKGLIDELAILQSPEHHEREKTELFDKINSFVRVVTGKPDAKIEVPHSREYLQVHIDNKVLPLESLGTGIHEVILIAAFCTLKEKQIVCIEEPEIHLHPVLQRKLISYIMAETDNQYFIATHSASFIDVAGASLFRVENDGESTRITSAQLRDDKLKICKDLGYKASDIIQSNVVIWVEGPSDRIYLLHWIKAIDESLQEGIHFSIMFYGGRLLSHLTAKDDEIEDFISLRSLNQNVVIMIDSDKPTAQSPINKTKERIQIEIEEAGGYCWITKGREVENYVPHSVLQAAVEKRHPRIYQAPCDGGQYDHPLYFERKPLPNSGSIFKDVDKVKVANLIAQNPVELDILDLKEKLTGLVEYIKAANDF